MRRLYSWITLVSLLGLLTFATVGVASASAEQPPIVVPQIIAVNSNAICGDLLCLVTAALTYDTAVGVTPNAALDFTVRDVTLGRSCAVLSVTSTPPPSPIVLPPLSNRLYLRASCFVRPGDLMLLVYRVSPVLSAGYVYNAHYPRVHARSPQPFSWFES
jgi:hypothetical protein